MISGTPSTLQETFRAHVHNTIVYFMLDTVLSVHAHGIFRSPHTLGIPSSAFRILNAIDMHACMHLHNSVYNIELHNQHSY